MSQADKRASPPLPDIFASVPDILLVVDVGVVRIVAINRLDGPLLGFDRSDLIDRHLEMLLPAASSPTALAAMDGRAAKLHRRDGSIADMDARVSGPFRAEGRTLRVVSLREQLATDSDEFAEMTRFLDTVIENLPDMLFVKDAATLRFRRFNRAGEELTGWRREDILGKSDHDLLPKEQADFFVAKDRETLRNKRLVDIPEEKLLTTAKGERTLHTRKLPVLDERGEPRYLLGISEDITGRKRVEAELKDANRFLDAVVENIPDMIFVKDAETLLFKRFNRAGEELLGWTREQLLGKTDHDFYPKEQADFFHAKDRETLREGKLVDVPEEPIQTKHKGLRWLHTKKVPVYDEHGKPQYLLGISEDITARKEAEARAHALERELAQVVLHASEAVISWGPEGKLVTWNRAAEAIYGLRASEAIGRDVEDLVPESGRASFRKAQQKVLAGEKLPVIQVVRLRGEQEIDLEESLFPIFDATAKVVRLASIARDVSEIAKLRRATEILGGARSEPAERRRKHAGKMREMLEAAEVVAKDKSATVLILGETGVGKSWLARRIHQQSPRASQPLFELNCASLDAQFVESELFGHERGAFTGAHAQKRGIVEVAEGGTLFLDEVGELPPAVQAKLLTFLESKSFRRLGGTRTMQADVRLIAATNADLKKLSDKGTFRRDLYFRLAIMPIKIPPLRERREEIAELAESVLADLGRRSDRTRARLGEGVVDALESYGWPGNVRELRNALERALILSRGETIELRHLPPEMRGEVEVSGAHSLRLEDVERAHILRVLELTQGNRTRAAELMGIGRSTLKRKLAELKLPEE